MGHGCVDINILYLYTVLICDIVAKLYMGMEQDFCIGGASPLELAHGYLMEKLRSIAILYRMRWAYFMFGYTCHEWVSRRGGYGGCIPWKRGFGARDAYIYSLAYVGF